MMYQARHLSAIFIANHTIRFIGVKTIHDKPCLFSRLPLLTSISIHVGDVMTWFIPMRILSDQPGNIFRCLFTHGGIVNKEFVEFFYKNVISPEQFN